jgi:AraC family L-rhamnose operon transcriptional activator RhaR
LGSKVEIDRQNGLRSTPLEIANKKGITKAGNVPDKPYCANRKATPSMLEYRIKDEQIELLNRRAATALRYFMSMYSENLPFDLTSFHYSPFQSWLNNPWHVHSHIEVQYVFRGRAEWRTKQTDLDIRPGKLMIIPSGLLHCRKGIADAAQMMGLHFHLDEKRCPGIDGMEFKRILQERNFVFDLPEALQRRIIAMPRLLLSHPPFAEQQVASMTATVLLDLFNRFLPAVLPSDAHDATRRSGTLDFQNQVYHTALKYVNDNLNKSISIDDVAKTCNVSSRHLNRIFSQSSGMTLGKHISKRRIEKSFRLLTQGESSLDTIASQLGFADAAHFIRTFKKSTGTTPGKYRKRVQS